MLHLTIMSLYTEKHHLSRLKLWSSPSTGAFFTSLWLSTMTLDGVARTENSSITQRTPPSCQALANKPQTRHSDSMLKILVLCSTYSTDKNSISKAINLTLQIIKFRSQKQPKRLASFIPATDTVVYALTSQGTSWQSGRTKRKFPKQGMMHFGLLQTPHGNGGVETARQSKPSQLAVEAGSTEGTTGWERALPSPDTKHNQTVAGIVQISVSPPKSYNTSGSRSPPSNYLVTKKKVVLFGFFLYRTV